jgi:hypothetical protein
MIGEKLERFNGRGRGRNLNYFRFSLSSHLFFYGFFCFALAFLLFRASAAAWTSRERAVFLLYVNREKSGKLK